jgi:hypothetical protein
MSAYVSIRQGLTEVIDFAKGKPSGAVVHRVEVPEANVAAIRASTGLSQAKFARSIGVAKGTLLKLGTRTAAADWPGAGADGDDCYAADFGPGDVAVIEFGGFRTCRRHPPELTSSSLILVHQGDIPFRASTLARSSEPDDGQSG